MPFLKLGITYFHQLQQFKLLSPLASSEAVFREFLSLPHFANLSVPAPPRQPPGPVSAGAAETGEPGFLTGVLAGPSELPPGYAKVPLNTRSPALMRESL